jgi:hypothetical protein
MPIFVSNVMQPVQVVLVQVPNHVMLVQMDISYQGAPAR